MDASHVASTSLYRRLLNSHLRIAGIAALLLCGCLLMILYLQQAAARVADARLPSVVAIAQVVNGIETSNNQLRSWVLLGERSRVDERRGTWEDQITPAMNDLEMLANTEELDAIASLRRKMELLKDSQWWVEDVATAMGNNPARLLYERNLLPIYDRIQRAVIGLSGGPTDGTQVAEIRLATAMTHQSLSEAVRQLSEAVRTGSVAEIKDFQAGSEAVEAMLSQLSRKIEISADIRPLLDWILREYHVYDALAEETIRIRQSEDWNKALYVLRTQTEPLADEVKRELNAMQARHNEWLSEDVSRGALIGQIGSLITLSMIFGLAGAAWAIARKGAARLVTPIEALSAASDQLVTAHDRAVQLPVGGPREVAHLMERFNFMSRELTSRTNDLRHANRELQEYTHIITHDLKPPLINIKGHAELIKEQLESLETICVDEGIPENEVRASVLRTLAEDIPECVNYIELSIAKTNKLISGVMDNSRLLFRETKLSEVNMSELLKQVIGVFSHRLDGVDLDCGFLPIIRTDPFLMEHIFSNLIDNALKYMDSSRPPQIEIRGTVQHGEAHFSVCDNGIGLSATAGDIFKLFRQGSETNSGSGVGLALVETMLAKLGGRIRHEPNHPHGSRFEFCVPLDRSRVNSLPLVDTPDT